MTVDKSLPSAPPKRISPHVTLQPPLTYRGHGPGLIIILPDYNNAFLDESRKTLDPQPIQKFAEEGYAVVEIRVPSATAEGKDKQLPIRSLLKDGVDALLKLKECNPNDKFGLIGLSHYLFLSPYVFFG